MAKPQRVYLFKVEAAVAGQPHLQCSWDQPKRCSKHATHLVGWPDETVVIGVPDFRGSPLCDEHARQVMRDIQDIQERG